MRTCQRAPHAGQDTPVVDGNREHAANLAYDTAHDPQFEDAFANLTPGPLPPPTLSLTL